MPRIRNLCATTIVLVMKLSATFAGEFAANAGVTNNYIWRGLTQSQNEPAISGGLDFSADNGLYVGTWASNVSYATDDVFTYENDIYFGYSGAVKNLKFDLGYLYYNYDKAAQFDFGEIYGELSYAGFTLAGYLLSGTEAEEGPGQDFGFGQAYYLSLDYSFAVREGLMLGLHVGQHAGDFNEAFNGVPGDYIDYSLSLSKNGFSFMLTDTNLGDVGPDPLDNDAIKIVVSFNMDFEL